MSNKKQKNLVSLIIVIVVIILLIWFFPQTIRTGSGGSQLGSGTEPTADPGRIAPSDEDLEKMATMLFAYQGQLVDVTEGKVVRGVVTNNTSGFANAHYTDGMYTFMAQFGNLPEPQNDDFYEGWLVRPTDTHVLSTGKLEKIDGVYKNHYMSSSDLTDHTIYVLTLEPDDGDPAPADHILEGELQPTN